MNLDETSVAAVQKPLQGVVIKTGRQLQGGAPSRLRAKLSMQRMNLTYVALISDDSEFNAELPQFIIGDSRSFTLQRFPLWRDAAPRNVYLLRSTKAWNNWFTMVKIIRILGLTARTLRPDCQVILCLDTANSHLHEQVLATSHEEGVPLVHIPARCTSLMQPLDVYVFRVFKERLRRRFHDIHGDATGPLSIDSLLRALYDAMWHAIVNPAWPDIFAKCGLTYRQFEVSSYIERHLNWPAHVVVALDVLPLSDADVRAVLPSNRRIPLVDYLPPPPAHAVLALADAA